jgi:hypothetical protein
MTSEKLFTLLLQVIHEARRRLRDMYGPKAVAFEFAQVKGGEGSGCGEGRHHSQQDSTYQPSDLVKLLTRLNQLITRLNSMRQNMCRHI